MDLRGLLKELEWRGPVVRDKRLVDWDGVCPQCRAPKANGHTAACELAAAITQLDGAHVQATSVTGHFRSVDYEETFIVSDKPVDMGSHLLPLSSLLPKECLAPAGSDDGPHGEFDVTVVFKPTV